LLPGRYVIKLLARDNETGHIGTYQATFTIPNLNKEVQHVPISSVVLSGQRVDAKDALYDAMKGKEQAKEMAANPLIVDGKRIVPSVTRVFTAGREMYVYLQAYEPESTAPRPLLAYLSLYRDSVKVFESKPTQAMPVAGSHLGMVPMSLAIDISHLPPGDYNCQMTILDPTAGKATYWQVPIKLVP
jgi:hypothetical protein